MPELIDGGAQKVSRRVVLRGAGALGLILTTVGGGVPAAASGPVAEGPAAGDAVTGAFSAPGYSWPTVASEVQAAEAVSGVVFALTAGGRPLADRRVRFSISSFHAVGRGVWFEASSGGKSATRLGYLDLDTDSTGTVVLDGWLRRGDVSTEAVGAHPVLRAQLVGSETILASARLSVS